MFQIACLCTSNYPNIVSVSFSRVSLWKTSPKLSLKINWKFKRVDNLQSSNVSQLTHLVNSCFVGLVFLGSISFFTNLVTFGRWRGTSSFLILMPSIRIPGPTIIFEGLVQIWRPCLRHNRRSQFYQFIGRIHYQIKLRQLHLFFLGIIIDINVNFVRDIFVDCKIAEIQCQNIKKKQKMSNLAGSKFSAHKF